MNLKKQKQFVLTTRLVFLDPALYYMRVCLHTHTQHFFSDSLLAALDRCNIYHVVGKNPTRPGSCQKIFFHSTATERKEKKAEGAALKFLSFCCSAFSSICPFTLFFTILSNSFVCIRGCFVFFPTRFFSLCAVGHQGRRPFVRAPSIGMDGEKKSKLNRRNDGGGRRNVRQTRSIVPSDTDRGEWDAKIE